ncbi:proton-coupled amino acid transporter-like protein CG1139 isoform X2 [Apis mellifera]|uniref:Proton-coupled amino acid transporter-like protein CG1139 isoform X2 n=1 Tax=Apis mellifera TaxID=7460 RepID=A0A7M7L020_APIME|nr:proton-coupled amino acid transporter-like protein CG1139 isoform X2 [Apis mellifera]|eukprot:XP_026295649.1 proton-coupled amino acid transporter-like protein CG1139 isoform X2 [Apis mellifera]
MENAKEETINMQLIGSESPYKVNNEIAGSGLNASEVPISQTTNVEDYDPHKHRNRPNPTSNAETLIHLLKGSLGTGILAMPNAFRNSGLVTGVIATVIIGVLCTYCLHVLVKAQYKLCKRLRVPILSYPLSMKYALEEGPGCVRWFAPYAPGLVDGFMIVYQLGICCVYIVFVASNIKQDLPSLKEREMFGTLRNFSLYFGTTLFALEAVGVIIALENNMKTPQYFGGYCGVLNIGMTVIVALYIVMGFFGYIKYGSNVEGSVTFNLPSEEIMAQSIKIMFAIAIFITHALQGYVPVDIIWNTYLDQKIQKRKIFWEYVCRTILTLSTFTLAITVPRLGLFISLFGALCLSALGIAFPAIIEICVLWPDRDLGPCMIMLVKNLLLIVFGLLGLVIGTYVSMVDIINFK